MKISNTIIAPMLVASGLFLDDASTDIMTNDNNSINLTNQVIEHLSLIKETNYSDLLYETKFKKALLAWKEETYFYSSPSMITDNKNFQTIISMGNRAVPFILEELKKEPSPIVWALNFIYGKRISNNPHTSIIEASRMWIKLLSRN